MSAKVSVILPSLNVADYIRECLDSVLNQSLQELEIICVDAGSTDGTAEILKEYAEKDSRIVLLNSGRKSYGRQVNMGLDYAEGEYIAVLETDDWAAEDMYQCLYDRAAADRLDYAAADFDIFYRLQSGCDYYVRQYLFPEVRRKPCSIAEKSLSSDMFPDARQDMPENGSISPVPSKDWYGKVLGADRTAVLRASDYVLWKGIYSRKFLNAHRIRFHESPGAAFQDMGFLQQVKTFAERAVYIDRSFYRYRQGREEASSGCLEGLRYYEGEFRWMETQPFLRILRGDHRRYYYFTMSISFITKYEQILSSLDGDWKDERLEKSYGWFQKQISHAIDKGLLEETMYGEELWERLALLLASREAHARRMMDRGKEREKPLKELICMTGNRPAVIFGCGVRGERLMLFCDRNHIRISGFCDNQRELQGGSRFGFPVMPPKELKKELEEKDGVVLLSMREGAGEVRKQIEQTGIDSWRVIDVPQGIL